MISHGTSTAYIGDLYEKHEDGSYVNYYWALGRRIAMRVHQVGDPDGVVSYLLADHLGSSTQVLNADGTLEESVKYYPYGSVRAGSMTGTDKKFTGQQEEGTDFGLYNYGARFYSTKLGRFLSADPLVVKPGDPQLLDRYAYVRNNPLRYVDPSGIPATPPGGRVPSQPSKVRPRSKRERERTLREDPIPCARGFDPVDTADLLGKRPRASTPRSNQFPFPSCRGSPSLRLCRKLVTADLVTPELVFI